MTPLGIAVWTLSIVMAVSLIWAVVNRRRGRRLALGLGIAIAAGIGLVLVWFAGMGAFCVPPPGSGCA